MKTGYKEKKRVMYEREFSKGISFYILEPEMRNVAKVKVNDIEIPVRIVKKDGQRFLDASYYIINEEYKDGILKIWVDYEK